MTTWCSDLQHEPLPGTARTGEMFVLMEHHGPWSRDILDGGTLAHTECFRGVPGLTLIRKPGREGRKPKRIRNVYLVFANLGIVEHLEVSEATVPNLDFSGPGRNAEHGARILDEPVLLTCTHAKRDQCCAVKGRPLVAALEQRFPEAHIWECSHAKGHRFAPAMLLYPWGFSFGRLNEQAAASMFEHARDGLFFYPGNRGRTTLNAQEQVAELAVVAKLQNAGEEVPMEALRTEGTTVTHRDGRCWEVALERVQVDGVISSCGGAPKQGKAWVARGVQKLEK
ncbi:sucrase ferredoxin [Corynebacterium gerontici]|uniref:Sucrase/ferredoxin-like protein n=1 Tax=Corynebacterium gerontici TaxID=2079234 RepID=A0A3G6IZ51_9CORY|nr:sucrase ferredoxin [Corynebacterium gerontici]AZA10783.1 Sucrase/ferredoxin-like protein [Corynebacterium gerontici]